MSPLACFRAVWIAAPFPRLTSWRATTNSPLLHVSERCASRSAVPSLDASSTVTTSTLRRDVRRSANASTASSVASMVADSL